MIKILVRFDDICPTMDFSQFEKACSLMDKYGVKPLIGVIPDCTDPALQIESEHSDFWNYVKTLQDKGYTIAMHGVNHVFSSKHKGIVNNRIGSEFAGLPLSKQISKIKEGMDTLESNGIHTDIFFAPAHSYDYNTMNALSQAGFRYMSDGKSCNSYNYHDLKVLPCRSSGCPRINGSGYYTAVFHAHEWSRKDKQYDFESFKKLLENHKDEIVPFSEYSQQPVSSLYSMLLNERLFVNWEYHIRPVGGKILRKLRMR